MSDLPAALRVSHRHSVLTHFLPGKEKEKYKKNISKMCKNVFLKSDFFTKISPFYSVHKSSKLIHFNCVSIPTKISRVTQMRSEVGPFYLPPSPFFSPCTFPFPFPKLVNGKLCHNSVESSLSFRLLYNVTNILHLIFQQESHFSTSP